MDLKHAVLVNPGFMREGIVADHGLVRRGPKADHGGEQLTHRIEAIEHDVALDRIPVGADVKHGSDLFERSVAGAFADPVDGALHLAHSSLDCRQTVRYRKTEVGSTELTGEKMFSVLERTWSRPTMDVHGMPGGFTGAGAKTVIPAKALAKISFRLVPNMKSETAFAKYKAFVEEVCPRGIQVDVRMIHSGEPIVVSTDNDYIRAAQAAMAEVFGKDTVFIRSGGSIPIVGDFDRHLGLPSVMMGFGLPDDNLHAPNEKFHLKNFELGIKSIIRFLEETGR